MGKSEAGNITPSNSRPKWLGTARSVISVCSFWQKSDLKWSRVSHSTKNIAFKGKSAKVDPPLRKTRFWGIKLGKNSCHACICTHARKCTCIHTHIHTFTHTHAHKHTYINIYTHTTIIQYYLVWFFSTDTKENLITPELNKISLIWKKSLKDL